MTRILLAAALLSGLAAAPAAAGPADAGSACGSLFKDDLQKFTANGSEPHPHRWIVTAVGDKVLDVALFVHKPEGWERHDGYRCRVNERGDLAGEAPGDGKKTWLDAPAKR